MSELYETMPKSVRIGCYNFRVIVGRHSEHLETFGHMDVINKEISIAPGLRGHDLANTFLHEVIHAVHVHFGLLHMEELRSEEAFTTLTANGLCAFWQDNPKAIDWFMKAVTTDE